MAVKRTFYLNTLFDCELAGFPTGSLLRFASELTTLFIPLARACDHVCTDVGVPEQFGKYLDRYCPMAGGELYESFLSVTGASVAWGWNRTALERLAVEKTGMIPSLEAVAEVNGRRFCSSLYDRYSIGVPGSFFCATIGDVAEVIDGRKVDFPFVVKSNFGSSGYGIRIIRKREEIQKEMPLIDRYISTGGVVVEPWLERIADLSAVTVVKPDGSFGPVMYQRQRINRFGSYYGNMCGGQDDSIEKWRGRMAYATGVVVREVACKGYFGPLGIDFFVYTDRNGDEQLASCIEINARLTMGILSQLFREQIAPDKYIMMRFLRKKRCLLPESITEWREQCGNRHFRRDERRGILLLTPLRVSSQGKWRQPQQSVFFLAADTSEELEELDGVLRTRVVV